MKFKVKKPIPGFENLSEVEFVEVDNLFSILKADDKVLFTLINPYALREFSFNIPADVKALLEINENSKLLVYVNIVKKEPISESIVNFKAPMIFNLDNNTCAQVVLENEHFEKLADFIAEDNAA